VVIRGHKACLKHPRIVAYDVVRLSRTRAAPLRCDYDSPDFFRNLGERVLFEFLCVAVEFADAFG
jgi:hypothetical protein